LTITKAADASKVPFGGDITYTLTVANTGTVDACPNVVVTDDIADHTDCTSTTQTAGFVQTGCDGAAGVPVLWTAAAGLAANTTATLTMNVTVTSSAVAGESITNLATGAATGGFTATSNTTTVTVEDCDLAISKSDDPSKVAPDGQITYTIKVENAGTVDCTEDITVTDGIPGDTDCVSIDVTDDNGLDINFDDDDCDSSGNVVWDTDDTLDNGDEVELQMVVELNTADDGDTIENEACVQATGFAEVCDQETTKVDEDVVTATKTPTPGPTATVGPTATPRPVVPVAPPVAPAPPAPSAGQAPSLVSPLTGTGAESGAGGSQSLALALGLAGGCLLLLGGVAMLRRPR
jgi:uncharacterized repeat protein (TIGR01451 family)